jgi:hypothetical protein
MMFSDSAGTMRMNLFNHGWPQMDTDQKRIVGLWDGWASAQKKSIDSVIHSSIYLGIRGFSCMVPAWFGCG